MIRINSKIEHIKYYTMTDKFKQTTRSRWITDSICPMRRRQRRWSTAAPEKLESFRCWNQTSLPYSNEIREFQMFATSTAYMPQNFHTPEQSSESWTNFSLPPTRKTTSYWTLTEIWCIYRSYHTYVGTSRFFLRISIGRSQHYCS